MTDQHINSDQLIFSPDDVDLSYSPFRKGLKEKTFLLGAFNPGLCRLPNGNLLMMVRVAEALSNAVHNHHAHCIRWQKDGYTIDKWPLEKVTINDPRVFKINQYNFGVLAVTSLS